MKITDSPNNVKSGDTLFSITCECGKQHKVVAEIEGEKILMIYRAANGVGAAPRPTSQRAKRIK